MEKSEVQKQPEQPKEQQQPEKKLSKNAKKRNRRKQNLKKNRPIRRCRSMQNLILDITEFDSDCSDSLDEYDVE